jgi:hypothetical protein
LSTVPSFSFAFNSFLSHALAHVSRHQSHQAEHDGESKCPDLLICSRTDFRGIFSQRLIRKHEEAFQLSSPNPASMAPSTPATPPAQRLHTASWLNGRSILGVLLVVAAVLAGALFLQRAQRLMPVYEAARDLPSGVPLSVRDLAVVRVRLPAAELERYARADLPRPVVGQVLVAPLRKHMLVPVDGLASSLEQADMVELSISVNSGDMAQGLQPGDHVQVLAAYRDGALSGQAQLLLRSVEVVRVLEEPSGLAGSRQSGVQVRVPSDRTAVVVAAIASARVFVVRARPLTDRDGAAIGEPPATPRDGPGSATTLPPPSSVEPGSTP